MPSFGSDLNFLTGLDVAGGVTSELHFSAPETADEFARQAILAICSASVTPMVGRRIYERCLRALAFNATARLTLRHPGKASAIDLIWHGRERLYREYLGCSDKLAFLATLPWIGPVTKHSLARRFGLLEERARRKTAA